MILSAVENVLIGLEVASASTVVTAIIAEVLLTREAKAAIGAWIMRKVYENFFV
tara:strand:+ start:4292 stop:4453 length:162 start_codon:yes stop_codon:yes gene_type:complete